MSKKWYQIFLVVKDKLIQNYYLNVKICFMLIAALIMIAIPEGHILAATGLQIYDYSIKKDIYYTDKQIKATFNGQQITNTATPGILRNGTSLVPYQDVFENSIIASKCSYNALSNTITISKYGNVIVMKVGDKKASVNGKSVSMSVAPTIVKYKNANITKVLVPSRFVAEQLGMRYSWFSGLSTVAMEKKTLNLSYNGGEKFEYTGILGQVTIDGEKLRLGDMPSISINNTIMVRVKKVFVDSKIKASYSYNKKDKSITLKKNGNTLVMTLGSTTAYLNGNPTELDTAPISVKNYKVNLSFIMVPGSITASCLGYDYAWDQGNAISSIMSRKDTSNASNNNGGSTELGDDNNTNQSSKEIAQWQTNTSEIGKGSDCHELNSNMISLGRYGRILTAARDYNTTFKNAEKFVISSDTPFEKVTSNQSGNLISIKAEDKNCTDSSLPMANTNSKLVNNIKLSNNQTDLSTTIEFGMLTGDYNYELTLSADGCSLYVTIYQNSLTSVTIGTNSIGDYITFNCLSAVTPVVSKEGSLTYIDLPYVSNNIGDMYHSLMGTKYINLFNAMNLNDKTRLIVTAIDGYETQIIPNGTKCTVYFKKSGAVIPSEGSNTSGTIDKSKYEIVIPKPTGISKSMITDEDYYDRNKFVIRIPGDYTAFYQAKSITKNSGVIQDISVSLNNRNETEILISTSKLQGYEYALDNDNIYVNIGDPREIYKNIVVLDPGHGNTDNGAQYFGTKEKDLNLKILYTVGKKYFNSDPSKLKVYYTKTTDVLIPLNDRAAFAKKVGADLFVSLHMNAVEKNVDLVRGTEVYYSSANNNPNQAGLTSETFASIMVGNLANSLGTNNRKSKSARYVVVHTNTVPAILIELGFLSNKNDFAMLTDENFQDNAARVIYQTLLQVFETYPTGR